MSCEAFVGLRGRFERFRRGGDDHLERVHPARLPGKGPERPPEPSVKRRLLAYEDAFNSSMHNYYARIELKPTASSGTVIHWYGEYGTSRPLRWVMPRYLRKFMQGMAEGLARYAEERRPDQ